MHLAIEAQQLRHDHRGVGRYVRRLLSEMPRHRPSLRYTVGVARAADVAPVRQQLALLSGVLERSEVVELSAWRGMRCDVAWYPWNFVRHRPAAGAIVPTIHDLAPMLQLDGRWWKVVKRWRARRAYAHAVAAADRIITGAVIARDELVRVLGAPSAHIHVVPHAADGFAVDPTAADTLLHALGAHDPFLLAVGSQEARKNLRALYAAMDSLQARGRTMSLVLCGPRGTRVAGYGSRTPAWLHPAGFVSDAQLAALYVRSLALVFPSRYEGFGLPVLEALTAGGVVVCSNASTLPEVGGDAVLYFAPDDVKGLVHQVERLLDEPELRPILQARGAKQGALFSWAQSALGTLAAFDAAIASRMSRA